MSDFNNYGGNPFSTSLIILGIYTLLILIPLVLIKSDILKPSKQVILFVAISNFLIGSYALIGHQVLALFESNPESASTSYESPISNEADVSEAYEDSLAWIEEESKRLHSEQTQGDDQAVSSSEYETSHIVISNNSLALRDKPSISSQVLTLVKEGELVSIIHDDFVPLTFSTNNKNGYWQKVKYKDMTGFMFDGYLSDAQIVDFTKHFSGTIDNKYKIDMTFTKIGTSLVGEYSYSGKSVLLLLRGTINENGNLEVQEFNDKGEKTGIFRGLLAGNSATGQWSNVTGNKIMPFIITEKTNSEKSIYELLQGKWQSDDDPKSFIVFDKSIRKDVYDGDLMDEEEYVLSDYCLNDLDKDPDAIKDPEHYMSLLNSNMCFHIDNLDNVSLSLLYMGRGNFHGYKRVK